MSRFFLVQKNLMEFLENMTASVFTIKEKSGKL